MAGHKRMEAISLLTKHQKEAALLPALASCGFAVSTIDHFDTDSLGTFTGEQERSRSQLETARYKAQLAAQLGSTRYGLGSEGSFGPDPFIGLTPWNIEMLAWWDALDQHAVFAIMQGPETNYHQKYVRSMDEANEFLNKVRFPSHGVIVGTPEDNYFNKEIKHLSEMTLALQPLFSQGITVWLETDMRAHRNPARMLMIERCANRLAANLRSRCPVCSRGGFVASKQIPGALCEACGGKTQVARAELLTCAGCNHQEERALDGLAPAARCDFCNP